VAHSCSLKCFEKFFLKQVSNILTDDNPNNDESACGRFDTFINQVNAAERRDDDTLTADQADELRTQAEDITNELLLGSART